MAAALVSYALEDRSPGWIFTFAIACVLSSVYGFLQGRVAVRDHRNCVDDCGAAEMVEDNSRCRHAGLTSVQILAVDETYSIHGIFLLWQWDVEFTDEFGTWWDGLNIREQKDVSLAVTLLEEKGPALRRPHVGAISNSRHANMKELVIQHAGRPYRVLFAFDPRRTGILLIGGDKTG